MLRYWVEKFAFGIRRLEPPTPSKKEQVWLTGYGITSGIYRVIVFAGILLFVADRLLLIGILMACVCAISWIAVPTVKLIKYLASDPRLERQRPRAVAITSVFVGGLLVLLQFVPLPYYFRAQGIIEAQQWTQVLTEVPGVVYEIVTPPGQPVKAGQELIRLRNPELDLELASAQATIDETEARLRQAMQESAANMRPLRSRMEATKQRLDRIQTDQRALVVRARQDGIWVGPQTKDFIGKWLPRGNALGLIIDPRAFEFNAVVLQEDADRLFTTRIGKTQVRLHGEAGVALDVGPIKVVPGEQRLLPSAVLGWAGGGEIPVASDDPQGRKTLEPFYSVRTLFTAGKDVAMLHGRSGTIRFALPDEPLLPRWIRQLRQLLQQRYQI